MANLAYGIPFEVDTPTNIASTSKHGVRLATLIAERPSVPTSLTSP